MSIGRAFAGPFRRLLDPRFGGLANQADVQHRDLADRLDELNRRVADRDTIAEMFEAIREELAAVRETLIAMPAQELATLRRELTASALADMEANREANELLARTLGDVLSEVTATRIALEGVLDRDLETEPTVPNSAVRADRPNQRIGELP
jgi:division protein CdvB (Snf7/Vps24/ESCRT-III family)